MTAELGDWLAELGESEPVTAAEVGAALVAVLESAEPSDLAIVGEPGVWARTVIADPRETVDLHYQQQLEALQLVRRRAADAASARKAAELRLADGRRTEADASEVGELERDLAGARQREARLSQFSQRIQRDADAFRTAKETAKAIYTAAEANLRIAGALKAAGGEPDSDLAQLRADCQAAEKRLRALAAQESQPISAVREQAGPDHSTSPRTVGAPPAPPPQPELGAEPVPGLLELTADPLGSDIRILLAAEPAGTVTLLAVLEGPQAVSEHSARAVTLAGDLLTEIRDDGWPADIDEVLLADPDEFRARFFPADDGSIGRRAGLLAAMMSLSALRAGLHLTIDEVAARSGLARHRVEAIERAGLRTARVHEAVALARVLGARLELAAGPGPVAG
ncbi:MAG: hypothetical protein ACRDOK_13985 [Streptosporangiaceae bacterium]